MYMNLFFMTFILIKPDFCFSKKNGHEISKLIQSILKDYDKHQSPTNGTVPLNIFMKINNFEVLDEDSFQIGGILFMRWVDERITWDSSKYFNKPAIVFNKDDIWQPTPAVVSSIKPTMLQIHDISTSLGKYIRCTSRGLVHPLFHFSIYLRDSCNSYYKNWPHDLKSCRLSIAFPSSMGQNITFLSHYKNLYVNFNSALYNKGWNIIKKSAVKIEKNESKLNEEELVISFDVMRNGSLYGSVYFQPCLVILGITLALFWMDVQRPERTVLIGLLMTVQCAIFTSMMHLIPSHGDQTPFVMFIYSITFFFVIKLFLVTTLSRKMLSTTYNPSWLQFVSAISVGNSIISYSLFLNVNPRTAAELIEEDEEGSLLIMKTKKLQKQWKIVVQMLNSSTFILFIPISVYVTLVYCMYM